MSAPRHRSSNSHAAHAVVPGGEGRVGNGAGVTVVLADDHAVVRRGLRMVLEEAGLDLVGEAADTPEARRKVLAYKPNVLVLDLSMPGGSSLEAIPCLLEISPETAIVILTMHDEPALARDALRAGARAFVLKEASDSELVDAIFAASGGDRYLNPRLGARIAAKTAADGESLDGLTARELEVLRRLAAGYTNLEIARQMHLALRTVEGHRVHLLRKLGRSSRVELVAYAREHGLFP
jgi:two-component system, NarL family, response regulator NreC